MKFIIMFIIIPTILILGIICFFWDELTVDIPKIKTKKSKIKKSLIERSNQAGEKYWEIIINGEKTGIHWDKYADAKFCYDHIIKDTIFKYVYESTCTHPYFILYLDKCTLFVVPSHEAAEYHYSDLTIDSSKYIMFLHKAPAYRASLEQYYNNIIKHDYWEEKTILSTDKITKEVEEAISNKDIKQLKKLIDDYKDTVELSKVVSGSLVKMLAE